MVIQCRNMRKIKNNSPFGYALHKIVLDETGNPVDYTFLEVNKAFEKLTGLKARDIIDRAVTKAIPGIDKVDFDWIGVFGKVALTGEEATFEQFSEPLGSWYRVQAYSPEKGYFVTIFTDITAQKFLSEIAVRFNDFSAENLDFGYLTDKAREISGANFAAFNKFDENGRDFTTLAVSGIDKYLDKVVSMLGYNIRGKKWAYDPVRQEKINHQKTTVFDKLADLTGTVIPEKVITLIKKTFDIGPAAVIKTTRDGKMLGDFTLIFPRGGQLQNRQTLETFADLCGMLLSKIDNEQKAFQKQDALEKSERILRQSLDSQELQIALLDKQSRIRHYHD